MQYTTKTKLLQAAAGTAAAVALFAAWPGAARSAMARTQEPARAVGTLIIPGREFPGAGREDARKIDNERRLAEKLARWEARKTDADPEEKPEPEEEPEPERVYLGRYKITGYDTCSRCCGNSNGITASGTQATVGRTCAAGRDLPFGTVIYIEGLGERVVEDRGGAVGSGHIDVLCSDHPECYSITGYYDVWEVVQNG